METSITLCKCMEAQSLSGQAQDGIIVKGRKKPRLLAWGEDEYEG